MSKEFKNIDDLFLSAFENDAVDVPEFVKNNIDAKIGFRKNKSKWFWLSGILSILVIGAVTIGLLTKYQPADSPTIDAAHETEKLTLNESHNTVTNFSNTKKTPVEKTSQEFSKENHTFSSVSAPDSQGQSTNGNSLETTNDKKINTSSSDFISDNRGDQSSEISDKEKVQNHKKTNSGITLSDTDQILFSNGSNSFLFAQKPSRIEELHQFQFPAPTIQNQFKRPTPKNFSFENHTENLNAVPLDKKEIYNPWMISATGGLNFSNSNYSSAQGSEADLYKNSTSSKSGFDANIDVNYRLKSSLTFGTGAGISKISENYEFFKEDYITDTLLTWTYIYDLLDSNHVLPPIDSTSVATYDTSLVTLYDAKGTTDATYLNIPISIGTQIIRNKFRFDFYITARFNYLLNGTGGYLSNDLFTTFSKSQNQIFKTTYFDFLAGVAVHYQIASNLFLTGTFKFKPSLVNLYDGLSVNRSVQAYQIGMGMSWKF